MAKRRCKIMAEYHVTSGAFGIYAGTVNPKRKDGAQT